MAVVLGRLHLRRLNRIAYLKSLLLLLQYYECLGGTNKRPAQEGGGFIN